MEAGGEPKAGSSIPWSRKAAIGMCAHESTESGTVYFSGREGCWKQLYTECNLISVP